MARICTYVLYISATSRHHGNHVREASEHKGGERRSGVLLEKKIQKKQGVSWFSRVDLRHKTEVHTQQVSVNVDEQLHQFGPAHFKIYSNTMFRSSLYPKVGIDVFFWMILYTNLDVFKKEVGLSH